MNNCNAPLANFVNRALQNAVMMMMMMMMTYLKTEINIMHRKVHNISLNITKDHTQNN